MRRNFILRLVLACMAGIVALFATTSCSSDRHLSPDNNSNTPQTAQHLGVEEAKAIALTFLGENGAVASSLRSVEEAEVTLAYQEPIESSRLRSGDALSILPAYYVFNVGESGFVVVSAWNATLPILGFSDESPFFTQEQAQEFPGESANVLSLLSAYAASIDSIRQVAVVDKELLEYRDKALRGSVSSSTTRAYDNVAPLLGSIKWNQSPYYNALCPTGTPVGCVATATCMIMKYWEYPSYGKGSHRSTYDGRVANFEHQLNWSNMPAATLRTWNNDVAQFCYDVAVGLNMMFSTSGSGTWQYYVPDLLMDHYYYKNTARHIYRSNYTTAQWENIVYNELANRRPVQYAGGGTGGAHSFVCDGYNSGYYHINWGWGGMSNGYFLLHALDPNSLGVGGGSGGGFNYNQDIVIGIEPDNSEDPEPEPTPEPTPSDDYCTAKGLYARSTFISYVDIAGMSNATSSNTGGYNYFANKPVTLQPGERYTLTLTPGSIVGNYPEYWRVWIDFNGDKQFGSDELVTEFTTSTANVAVKRDISLPATVSAEKSRMRIAMKWGSYPTACETFEHGEVEDYPVYFETEEPAPVEYPESYSRNSYYAYIYSVQMGSMTHVSAQGSYYADYSTLSDKYIVAQPGRSLYYQLSTAFGTYQTYWCYWRVWIDYNKNGLFENSEQMLSTYNWQPVRGYFSLPARMAKGAYRVRVSMKMNDGYPAPDEIFNYGEVEDYTLLIN